MHMASRMMPSTIKVVKTVAFTGYSPPLFELFMPVTAIPANRIPAYAMDLSDVITSAFDIHSKGRCYDILFLGIPADIGHNKAWRKLISKFLKAQCCT
jgi:hypothetical protein